jgi:hypothetical protein
MVLGGGANNRTSANGVILTDGCFALNHGLGFHNRPCAKAHIIPDDAVGSNHDVIRQLGPGCHDGCRVDCHAGFANAISVIS